MSEQVQAHPFVIGYHAGAVGRIARLVLGGSSAITGVLWLAHNGGAWWGAGLAFVGAVAFYVGIYRLVVWPPLAREPWLGTFVVLAPLGLLALSVVPSEVRTGVSIYIGASLVVNALIAYGGCEAIALPALLSGHRPTVYCPYNAIDAVERPLQQRHGRLVWLASALLAVTVGAYFLFVGPLLGQLGVHAGDLRLLAAALLVPAGALGWHAWRGSREYGWRHSETTTAALGTAALVAMAVVFAGLVGQDILWGVLMLAGAAFAIVRLSRRRNSATRP